MNCEELRDAYELYALGVLEDEEKTELDAHLRRDCPVCTEGFRRALALNAALGTIVEGDKPAARLRRRVLASVGVEPSGWVWMATWALMAAGLAVVFFVRGNDYRRDLAVARQEIVRTTTESAKFQQAIDLLNEPETEQVTFGAGQPRPPRGRVFVNAKRGVLLLASNLPPATGGKIYEMWLIPKSGAPKPAGLFQSGVSGNALYVLNQPIDRASMGAIAVTLEPQAGSLAPTTTPIIVASL